MYCSLCAMVVALEKIDSDDPLLVSAKEHLTIAVDHARRYHEVQNGIYWMTATLFVKRCVRSRLNGMAYDAYSALVKAAWCLDSYDERCRPFGLLPDWWHDVAVSLTLAHHALVREHRHEIASKQLGLFDD